MKTDSVFQRFGKAYRSFMGQPLEAEKHSKKNRVNGQRGYAAAEHNRLNADMKQSWLSADNENFLGLRVMRGRSRQLCMSEPYSRAFKGLAVRNVVGPYGFSFRPNVVQPDGKTPDLAANTKIKTAWRKWSKARYCSVTKRQSWNDICRLAMGALVQDGEAFIRLIKGFKNDFGFAVQILEADHFDELLMISGGHPQLQSPNNRVVMGVEINEWREPVAYWFRKRHPGDIFQANSQWYYEQVPASEILHIYMDDRPEQTRGVPWLFIAINRLNQMGAYEEGELIAARVNAYRQGFLIPKNPDATFDPDDEENGEMLSELGQGQIDILPEGLEFQESNPNHPNPNLPAFVKAMLRAISAGLGTNYTSLTGDLEAVNFSSIRAGTLDSQDMWTLVQNFLIEHLAERVYEAWLEMAMLSQQVVLPISKFDKFNVPGFRGRRWPWVDPQADAQSNAIAVAMGWKTNRHVAEDMDNDQDYDEVQAELKSEKEDREAAGLVQNFPNVIAPVTPVSSAPAETVPPAKTAKK